MSPDPASMDQAVARALRANLEGVQRQSEALHQAVADLVAACSSTRASNALPHLVRAQANAASLAAILEVLSKFITASGSGGRRRGDYDEPTSDAAVAMPAAIPEPSVAPIEIHYQAPAASAPEQHAESAQHRPTWDADPNAFASQHESQAEPEGEPQIEYAAAEDDSAIKASIDQAAESHEQPHEPMPMEAFASSSDSNEITLDAPSSDQVYDISVPENGAETISFPATPEHAEASSDESATFDINKLPADQQEMHRRANRVAKVSMQDIQLLRPDDVKAGRVNRDICIRLKDEIEKARREYERRFRPILGHGVDYFYHWMVEVLGAGDPEALGEYPYQTTASRQ